MKYEWRKLGKDLYLPKQKAIKVSVPAQRFVSIKGVGNPNGDEFKQRLQVLYPISYGIKGGFKKCCEDKDVEYDDYVVFPLEGVWSLTKKGQELGYLDKNEFSYDIMIRIPDFVPDEVIDSSIKNVKKNKFQPLMDAIELKKRDAYEAIEILHVGPFDTEPDSFKVMEELSSEINRPRKSKIHREIYLSDARRIEPARLKTVLRYEI